MTTEQSKKKVDYLMEDPIIESQRWICVSFLSPEGVKNCTLRGFKFRGAFPTRPEAEAHAKEIQAHLDPDFHVYVGEGFKWLPWNQDPETVENQEYGEDGLNELMKNLHTELLNKKKMENERKKQFLQSEQEELVKPNKVTERLRKKKLKRQQEKDAQSPKEPQIVKPEETAEKVKEMNENEKKLAEEKQSVAELNGGLQKLQSVYAKLLEKSKQEKK